MKGPKDGKKRAAEDGGIGQKSQRLAPALRKDAEAPTSENAECDRLLGLKNEEKSIRKEFNEQMKAMQESFEKRIAEKRREIEEARAVIRSKGDVEPDSLLFVGADLISRVLLYLKPRKMIRLGVVCKRFQRATHLCLVGMDSATAECDRADMECPRARAMYYLIASKFAERQFKRIDGKRYNCVSCKPYCYGSLDLVKFYDRLGTKSKGSAEYLFFVRFSQMTSYCHDSKTASRPTSVAQGFIRPHFDLEQKQIHLGIESFDFSKWPLMKSLSDSSQEGDERRSIDEQSMRDIFGNVSVVVVALRRCRSTVLKNARPSIVFMANNFGSPGPLPPKHPKYSSGSDSDSDSASDSDSDSYMDDSPGNLPLPGRKYDDWQRHMAYTYDPDTFHLYKREFGPGIYGTLCFGRSDEAKSVRSIVNNRIVLRIDQKLAASAAAAEMQSSPSIDSNVTPFRCWSNSSDSGGDSSEKRSGDDSASYDSFGRSTW